MNPTLQSIKQKLIADPKIFQKLQNPIPEWVAYVDHDDEYGFYQPGKIDFDQYDMESSKYKRKLFLEHSPTTKKLAQLKKNNQIFIDDQFPANDQSLYGRCPKIQLYKQKWKNIQWRSLFQFYPKGTVFPKQQISPLHIKQGRLGDCYFLAALAALAQEPDRIKDIFLLQEQNQYHYFCVKLLFQGQWRRIHLDAMVPFIGDKPAFSVSIDDGLWVILLEKAWAKLYKSYYGIEKGYAEEGLHCLTGAPIVNLSFNTKDNEITKEKRQAFWKQISKANRKNYPIVCNSKNYQNQLQITSAGLKISHSYTMIDSYELQLQGKLHRLVKLRNPWGQGQYIGSWGNNDGIWDKVPKITKQKMGYTEQNCNGVFFMDYTDFSQIFGYISIGKLYKDPFYCQQFLPVNQNNYDVYFTLKIGKPGKYCLLVEKPSLRNIQQKQRINYRHPKAEFQIKKIKNDTEEQPFQHLIQDDQNSFLTLSQNFHLVKGKYVVRVRINFNPKFQKDYIVNLGIYSEYPCGLYISPNQDAHKFGSKQLFLGQYYKYIFRDSLQQLMAKQNTQQNGQQQQQYLDRMLNNVKRIIKKPDAQIQNKAQQKQLNQKLLNQLNKYLQNISMKQQPIRIDTEQRNRKKKKTIIQQKYKQTIRIRQKNECSEIRQYRWIQTQRSPKNSRVSVQKKSVKKRIQAYKNDKFIKNKQQQWQQIKQIDNKNMHDKNKNKNIKNKQYTK